MASSVLSFSCAAIFHCQKCRTPQSLQVRAHSFKDEGRSSYNIVDSNLSILSEKIEEVKMKERLERCCRTEHGWNYAPESDYKHKKEMEFSLAFFEVICMVGGTVGLTILSATFCLCFVSLIVHFNQ